ncbi:hypothetical protein QTG54_006331 [Skeletonema marinoi]|uniref:Activator of Hsp90 ATPase N-terminal domain-containing protein n=1 Tax=Skeletonema marinoi TaxID=267567 RepID=A0A7S2LC86_9STRA|nr:hypothetical protein QTG54_006331 [Skeletonema marinoi]|mmetsp:Transcript_23553/g.40127  ORF Transcript_23553/g.40127 Transcript_23553/m.40127 type:complete len:189 (+) Transcript_23553:37-603(+)
MAPFLHAFVVATTLLSTAPATTSRSRPDLLTSTGNARKLLFEESWESTMSPKEAINYLMTPSTWISIVPDSEEGFITDEVSNTGEEGTWSLTTNDGTHLLCRNTQAVGCKGKDSSSCYLSYNVQVTFTDGLQFMLDIEYDLAEGKITRTVFDPETLNLKTKMMKPLIRSPLKEMMQEENRRLKKTMNS